MLLNELVGHTITNIERLSDEEIVVTTAHEGHPFEFHVTGEHAVSFHIYREVQVVKTETRIEELEDAA